MKTILVCTDFSDAAHNAFMYGVRLAKAFNIRLQLLNVFEQTPEPVSEMPVITNIEEVKKSAEWQLDKELSAFPPEDLSFIEASCTQGWPVDRILHTAEEMNVEMIIVGMKAGGKGIRRFLGSTVSTLARRTGIPLLVIPEDVSFVTPDRIMLAHERDLSPETDLHFLDLLCSIAERFHSKLFLVRVARYEFSAAMGLLERPNKISRMVRSIDTVYENLQGKDLAKTLNGFVAEQKINIIAMIPHKHSLFERMFIKSATKSMIFEAKIPLLILPE